MPQSDIFFGDYNNISAHNGVIRPIWTRLHDGNLSIWTAIYQQSNISQQKTENVFSIEDIYQNLFSAEAYFAYKLSHSSDVNIRLFDVSGNLISTITEMKPSLRDFIAYAL